MFRTDEMAQGLPINACSVPYHGPSPTEQESRYQAAYHLHGETIRPKNGWNDYAGIKGPKNDIIKASVAENPAALVQNNP